LFQLKIGLKITNRGIPSFPGTKRNERICSKKNLIEEEQTEVSPSFSGTKRDEGMCSKKSRSKKNKPFLK